MQKAEITGQARELETVAKLASQRWIRKSTHRGGLQP
jgi:hypothetical protein